MGEFRKLKVDGKCIHCGSLIKKGETCYRFIGRRSNIYGVSLCLKCIKELNTKMVSVKD